MLEGCCTNDYIVRAVCEGKLIVSCVFVYAKCVNVYITDLTEYIVIKPYTQDDIMRMMKDDSLGNGESK